MLSLNIRMGCKCKLQNLTSTSLLIKYRFQWVVLEIEIFLSQIDDAKIALEETIDEKIKNLKTSKLEPIEQLDEAYDQIYAAATGRNDPNRRVIVNNALQWLLCSYRDLKIKELLVAVSLKRDGTKYHNLKRRALKNLLSNFMTEAPSGEVKLAHLTIRPYLEKRKIDGHFIFEYSNANLTAALTCLHVLRSPGTVYEHLPDDHRARIDNSASLNVNALTAYSSFYWSLHSRAASKPEDPPEELRYLLESMHGSLQRDSSDVSIWTPFHDAIERGQNEVVKYLIASNFSMDKQGKLGNTPLHEAVQCNNSQAVQLLLQGGVAIQTKNNNGNTPLHLAAFTSDYGIVHQLLREEAYPRELNSAGQAPIHIAVLHGCMEAIRAFISASLDIDYKDCFGNSPLHYAALTNQPNIASMLIQAGCTMNPQNEDGNSPLHFATKAAFEDLAALLLRNGAKMSTRNKDGQTPMDPEFLIELPSVVTKSLLDTLATEKSITKVIPESALDIKTSELCSECANFSFWLSTAAQSMSRGHHTSYSALQLSVAQVCKLCKAMAMSIFGGSGDMPTKHVAQRNYLMPWYSLIELFSQTRLTYPSDALLALTYVARHIMGTLRFLCVAGVWREDLPRGLLWKARTRSSLERPGIQIAPSWSCVSLIGPVSYSFARSISSLSLRDAPRFDGGGRVSKVDEFEDFDDLLLSAMTFQISSGDPLDHIECFFDLVEEEKAFLEGSKKYSCVVIARHCLDITNKGSRYIGLLVKQGEAHTDLLKTARVGIFVGPSLDHPIDKWVRKQISII
jgi:ankyrin repeat protein